MTKEVKIVNDFMRSATRAQVDEVLSDVILSDRQRKIFDLHFIRRMDIGFTADELGYSPSVICVELRIIRRKIFAILCN
jgi:DNA-directed RNA polymerase sigma subunit (sigma70/sigma32)